MLTESLAVVAFLAMIAVFFLKMYFVMGFNDSQNMRLPFILMAANVLLFSVLFVMGIVAYNAEVTTVDDGSGTTTIRDIPNYAEYEILLHFGQMVFLLNSGLFILEMIMVFKPSFLLGNANNPTGGFKL